MQRSTSAVSTITSIGLVRIALTRLLLTASSVMRRSAYAVSRIRAASGSEIAALLDALLLLDSDPFAVVLGHALDQADGEVAQVPARFVDHHQPVLPRVLVREARQHGAGMQLSHLDVDHPVHREKEVLGLLRA